MALIEAGANPDMFNSKEKYYILFVLGVLAIGIAFGVIVGFIVNSYVDSITSSAIYMCTMLVFGGLAILLAFFTIMRWMKNPH